jgi:hypothetical protein
LGIEVVTIDTRIVVASVDTYLHFAEAVNRLDLTQTQIKGLKEMAGEPANKEAAEGAVKSTVEAIEPKEVSKKVSKKAGQKILQRARP